MKNKILEWLLIINMCFSVAMVTALIITNEEQSKVNNDNSNYINQLFQDNKCMVEEIKLYKSWCVDMVEAIEKERL